MVENKFRLIMQLLQQLLEGVEITRGSELQNAYIFMSGRDVCVSE